MPSMILSYLCPSVLVLIFNSLGGEMRQSKNKYRTDIRILRENENFREGEIRPAGCGGHRVGS